MARTRDDESMRLRRPTAPPDKAPEQPVVGRRAGRPRTTGCGPPRLRERELELTQLEECVARCRGGEGAVLYLSGPPGIGKTALLSCAAASAQAAGLQVFQARCVAPQSHVSFGLVRRLFDVKLARLPLADREELLSGAAAPAGEVLFGDELGNARRPAAKSLGIEYGMYWLVSNLAEAGPLVIAVDDAHWCDLPSLSFLSYLATRIDDLAVALLVSGRDQLDEARSSLLRPLIEGSVCEPAALSPAAVGGLIQERLECRPDAEFVDACHRAAVGNPFLTHELISQIESRGIEPVAANAPAVCALHSPSVSRSVAERLLETSENALLLARTVATMGSGIELHRAAAIAGIDQDTAALLADELAGCGLLTGRRPLAYRHPLLESAVRDQTPAALCSALHGRAAGLLMEQNADPTLIASHLIHVDPTEDGRAVEILRTAAAAALRRGAATSAVDFLRRALREPLSMDMERSLQAELGQACVAADDPAAVGELERALALSAAPEERASIQLALGMARYSRGDASGARQTLQQGLDETADLDGHVRVSLQAAALTVTRQQSSTSEVLQDAKLKQMLASGQPGRTSMERLLLAQLAFESMQRGDRPHTAVIELAGRALPAEDAELLDTHDSLALPLAGMALYFSDDFALAEAAFTAEVERARNHGAVLAFATASFFRAVPRMLRGHLLEAMDDWQSALDAADQGWAFALPSARALYALAALERDEPDLAASMLMLPGGDDAWREHPTFPYVLAVRGRYHAVVEHDPERSLEDLLAAGALQQALNVLNPSALHWRAEAALAASALGRHEQAHQLCAQGLEHAVAYGAPRAIGILERTLGQISPDEHQLLRRSVCTLERSGARLEQAVALIELGAALRRDGQRCEAREPLARGLELAECCGSLRMSRRAVEELRICGARPRRARISGTESLTSGERRVVRLAAEGLTNRQIAQQLFVTLRTVETHLTHAYAKLEISSRRELTAVVGSELEDEVPVGA